MSLYKKAQRYALSQSKYRHLNAFNALVDPSTLLAYSKVPQSELPVEDGSNPLLAKPIAIKDNICTKELKTTASSGILKDYTSPYDATVVKLLQEKGAVVVGKTNMDEFGMGSHSAHSHFGPVKLERYEGEEASAGGSSGGSALAVASGQCWAALGTDTGGSVRLPAAYTGVFGFKPSYGLLSRWGVIAYANSLDTVGIFGYNTRSVRGVFKALNVHDPQDPTSIPPSTRERLVRRKVWKYHKKIGIPLDYNIDTLSPTVRKAWIRRLQHLHDRGHTLHPIRLPATKHALSAYYILAPAEASSNLAKYDGVRFGSRAEGIDGTPDSVLFAKTRGEGFGSEVQRRILLGAFSLSAQAIDNYFIQAQKVRRLVQQDFNNVFARPNPLSNETEWNDEGVDVILCPTATSSAPSLSEVGTQDPIHSYMNDVFTVPASLAGLPAISVPTKVRLEEGDAGFEKRDTFVSSIGLQVIGQYGDDNLVLNFAEQLERVALGPQNSGVPRTAWGHSLAGDPEADETTLRATGPGITTEESKAILQARTLKLLEKATGMKHLDEAAKMHGITRDAYVARWVSYEDPVAAERVNYINEVQQRVESTETQTREGKLSNLVTTFREALGPERLDEAATLFKMTRTKYVALFVDEDFPLATEQATYQRKKCARKLAVRTRKATKKDTPATPDE